MSLQNKTYQPQSWGRYPKVEHAQVQSVYWRSELPDFSRFEQSLLPYAYGRSYGDSCLNEGGVSLDVSHLNRFISFDEEQGLLCCEAGVSLADVFELMRSNGERFLCSPTENTELFQATIGGLGLSGVILWAEFRLKPIVNPFIDMERIQFGSLEEFLQISAETDKRYEYTMSWVDILIGGKELCRGIFMCGNNDQSRERASKKVSKKLSLAVPFDLPSFTLNTFTVKAFNELYYHTQLHKRIRKVVPYEPFFYPLDSIHELNRMYGKRGFLQYQFVVPFEDDFEAM